MRPQDIKKHGVRNIEYTLILGSSQEMMKKYIFRDASMLSDDWLQGDPVPNMRLKFSYTAKPEDHLRMLVKVMNMRDPEQGWTIGEYLEATEKCISYNHNTCKDALQMMADEFDTEWEVVGKTIHLRKVEYNRNDPLPMSYGKGNGFRPGVGRSNYDNSKPTEVLFIQGGERNINATEYGSKELLLPKNKRLKYDGKYFEGEEDFNSQLAREYVTDNYGYSLQRADKELKSNEEGSLDLSHIYPNREGIIAEVNEVDKSKNFYDFTDPSIPDDLDFTKYLIGGETMTVIFQSGILSGKEFDVKYIHKAKDNKAGKRFEIVPQEIDGRMMPDETFKPKKGDKYAVFGMMMPKEYMCNDKDRSGASWDMFREAVKYMYENEDPRFSFSGEMDGKWARMNWTSDLKIGSKIKLGGYVLFSDPQFQEEGVLIRIVNVKEYINRPFYLDIELSNVTVKGNIMSTLRKIESNEVVVEDKHKDSINFTKRKYRNTEELIENISGISNEFEQNLMNALIFEGMVFRAGAKALQYRFLAEDYSTTRRLSIKYNDNKRVNIADEVRIEHSTIDESKSLYWQTSGAFSSAVLDDDDKVCYLYLKCSKTLVNIEGRDIGEAEFVLSPDKIKIDDVEGHYMLWVGFFDKLKDGERNWQPMYGITEMTPGEITGDLLRSSDGKSYFDMLGNAFKLTNGYSGDDEQTLTWENGLLSATNMNIKKALKVIGEALISGFYFSDEVIKSSEMKNNQPTIILDGAHGYAQFLKGRIAGFNFDSSNLVSNSPNSSFEIANGVNSFMRIGGVNGLNQNLTPHSMIAIRNDKSTSISIGSYGNNAVCLDLLANAGAKAIKSYGPIEFNFREPETLSLKNLPTNNSNLSIGDVWMDSKGYLKIKK